MNRTELIKHITEAMQGRATANFSASDVNAAAVSEISQALGISDNATGREIREHKNAIFALIEEAVDEILPESLKDVFGQFAEIKSFARDAEVVFNIEKVGRNRAKLVISRGARGGIYRTARLANKEFGVSTRTYTAGVYVELEDILLGRISLGEMYNDILEGFEEELMREVFNALAAGAPLSGYERIDGGDTANVTTTLTGLSTALDKVLPYVKAYGTPTIFGSYAALSSIYNPLANTVAPAGYPNSQDSMDVREHGYVQVYKGIRLVELPNYLTSLKNDQWFYDPSYVFVIPGNIKPVKIALRGDAYMQDNKSAVGTEKWEVSKMMGVGIAMANNFAVIKVSDIVENYSTNNATDFYLDK